MPIIELELDARLILASGPAVIGFLVLVLMGSLRAFSRARDKLGLGKGADWRAEAFDTYPNAIDLAVYTTPDSPKCISTIAYFTYPLVLSVGLLEALWLWCELATSTYEVSLRAPFAVTALILWLLAVWQVGAMWVKRILNVPTLWKDRDA